MNSDIRYLQLLEDDLVEAARVEHELDQEKPAEATSRPLPRRDRHWGSVAAGLVAFLVLAGGIGFLAQGGTGRDVPASAPAMASPTSVGVGSVRSGDLSQLPGVADAAAPSATHAPPHYQALTGGAPQSDLSKIIRDGRIGLQLADQTFTRTVATVSYVARRNGGFVLSAATQNEQTGQFTLRVPAKNFDITMLQLRGIGGREGNAILYQDASGQDVTSQFVDLQARLKILKGQRTLLLDLRAKATSVSSILSLSNKINQVQLQIEQIQGQVNVINDQVAESTIKVELRERNAPSTHPGGSVDNPSLGSAWDRSVQGFLRIIGAVIVGLGYLIPLALLGLAVWGVVTLVRRRRRETS
jgi:hypothetical protein